MRRVDSRSHFKKVQLKAKRCHRATHKHLAAAAAAAASFCSGQLAFNLAKSLPDRLCFADFAHRPTQGDLA